MPDEVLFLADVEFTGPDAVRFWCDLVVSWTLLCAQLFGIAWLCSNTIRGHWSVEPELMEPFVQRWNAA